MRTGELYECVESPFSYSRSWGYTSSRILLYDGWLRQRLLTEILLLAIYSAFHRLSRSVNLEYYAFLVFSNYLIVTTPYIPNSLANFSNSFIRESRSAVASFSSLSISAKSSSGSSSKVSTYLVILRL